MRILILLLASILLTSCYNAERNCTDFKTGTFESEALVGTKIHTTKFIRNDTIEIDFYENRIDTFSIRWINDCEFVMKLLHPKSQKDKNPVHFKILTSNKDTYTFEYSMVIIREGQKKVTKKGTAKKTN